MVRAFEQGEARSQFWDNASTVASGLRVPKPLGDFLILEAVRKSGGTAIAVADEELIDAGIQLASEEGVVRGSGRRRLRIRRGTASRQRLPQARTKRS